MISNLFFNVMITMNAGNQLRFNQMSGCAVSSQKKTTAKKTHFYYNITSSKIIVLHSIRR